MSNSELYRTDRQCAQQLFLNKRIKLKQYEAIIRGIERDEKAVEKAAETHQRNSAVSFFLGKFMVPGKGYSIKPFGKDRSKSLLPNLEVEMDRSDLLSSLQDLRDAGLVHNNADQVNNSCQIRWFIGPKPSAE
jgi:hypothetical protein